MKKKILAIILSVLCLTMILPVTAFARDSISVSVTDPAQKSLQLEPGEIITVGLTLSRALGSDEQVVIVCNQPAISVSKTSDNNCQITANQAGRATIQVYVADERGTMITSGYTFISVTVTVPTYGVNCTVAKGEGTLTTDKTQATAGETVTITATPEEGYELAKLTAIKSNAEEIEISEDDTFTMPDDDVEILAQFKEIPVEFDVELSQTEFTYKGGEKGQVPEYTVRDKNGDVLEEGTDYTVSVAGGVVSKQINAGEVEIRFIPTTETEDEYTETTATYTIKPAKLQVSLDKSEFVYNGKDQSPTATVTGVGGDELTEGKDYQVTIGQAKRVDVGTYTVSVAAFNSNYEGTETSYTIKPTEFKVTLDKTEFTYDGQGHVPVYTVEGANGEKLEEGKDYHVSVAGGVVSKQVEVGTVEMVFYADNANYKDTTATYKIVEGSNVPKTGDSNNMWLYAAIAALALVAMGTVVLKKKADR